MTEEDLREVHREFERQLAEDGASIDGLYYCPLAPKTSDKTVIEHPDRKPGPGMLFKAAREMQLDLSQSWMVGDSLSDMLAGINAGCRGTILVRTGHALDPSTVPADIPIVADLLAAHAYILASNQHVHHRRAAG